jgi:hypothetical protein
MGRRGMAWHGVVRAVVWRGGVAVGLEDDFGSDFG